MLTAVECDQSVQFKVALCCRWNLKTFSKICFCFVLQYNKSLNDWSLEKQWICFPRTSMIPETNSILERPNSLFPSGRVIKVIPLKLFYYQTFFETWRNEHSWYEHYKNAIKKWGHRACLRVSRLLKWGIFTGFALKVWITFIQN